MMLIVARGSQGQIDVADNRTVKPSLGAASKGITD